jgi:peptidoglycan lytic transglycosylase G
MRQREAAGSRERMGGAGSWVALGVLTLVAALAAGAWLASAQLGVAMDQPGPARAAVRVQVEPGAALRSTLMQLQRQGALRHPRWVQLYLRLHRQHPRVQAGLYEIAAHATPREILQQFADGRVLLSSITVVEGWSVAQMRAALDGDAQIAHQTRGLSDAQLMQALGHPGQTAEGQFFPDTYRFAAGTSDRKILEMAYQRMQQTLAMDWSQRATNLPISTPQQALILASIIEKETARPDERPKIAAVFANRLRLGMRLQSDPTVIYGLGERYDGSIHTRDLQSDTPYNTYTRAGLPPTPIALPGAASLLAALHPADTDALYFVATGEGDGSHRFSATLAEHDIALRSYLRRLGASGSSAPSIPADRAVSADRPIPAASRP